MLKIVMLLSVAVVFCPPKPVYEPGDDEDPANIGVPVQSEVPHLNPTEAMQLQAALLASANENLRGGAQAACAGTESEDDTYNDDEYADRCASVAKHPTEKACVESHEVFTLMAQAPAALPSQSWLTNIDVLQNILFSPELISETTIIHANEEDSQYMNIASEETHIKDVYPFFSLVKIAEMALVSQQFCRLIQPLLRICKTIYFDNSLLLKPISDFTPIQSLLFTNKIYALRWALASTEDTYAKRIERIAKIQKTEVFDNDEAFDTFSIIFDPSTDIANKLYQAQRLINQDRKAAIAAYLSIATTTTITAFNRL